MTGISPAGKTKQGGFILPEALVGLFLLTLVVGSAYLGLTACNAMVSQGEILWERGLEVRNQ